MRNDPPRRPIPTALVQPVFAGWAILGATAHLCLPALHHATTPLGHVALWLWLLPAAAWVLVHTAGTASPGTGAARARPRSRAPVTRGSRRPRRPAVAPPVRRAG